jgi:lipooligosaccharide transport system permease protein
MAASARLARLGRDLPSPRRALRMVQRNLLVYKHGWFIILSGFFEPIFYLLGIGLGLGGMVPDIDGVPYTAFVAPGLLASSCLNGAITDGFFNIFFKLHYQKTYDGILATPMRVADIALGEAIWALIRGVIYAAGFLIVIWIMGALSARPILRTPLAILALPAAVLVAASFAAMALCVTSFAKKIQDFDFVVGILVMPMFLFGGIFFPTSQLPQPVQWIVWTTPLAHAVALLRQLTTGLVTPTMFVHVLYLVAVGTLAFMVAMRRLERALVK